ncbi:2-oxoacid:acceptor oxidoreductase subunit alpha [Tissierella sp. Yu-01]|uniref:2-oxoacid:acceptor oxidoreductase subunit alpha n=1 Tax=Tissierella sp. Yu-01 TaxID=3035694 RepID=UPI00240D1A7A|nr:2-oxoacid:acceptor oxidoreductase subunit alpha [Tissierella sp. Yu-01]WFA09922.1 2-oxoacid:acceptor oxidoreductase subunit alpha [Tissierella sp. Yu-01]
MDYTILVGGAAGQGIDTVIHLLERTIKRHGYYVFTYKNFMSMVRGGHNFMQVRFSDKPVTSYVSKIDMIFALNEETIALHRERLKDDGVIIIDNEVAKAEEYNHLPLTQIAKELNNEKVYPTVGFGALVNYFGLSLDIAKEVIYDVLGDKISDVNKQALEKGYDMLERKYNLEKKDDNHILINGNQALALGAIAAGCRYYCGYPMTPSSSVMTYMSAKANEMGIVVDQIEDEVGALNMALGASYAGVRALTGSSGGGFALMTEALSLAGITEIPIVVFNAQRPGPATGMATRTEQSDLRFVIHAGHGEFPKMVIALRTPYDAFYQTARAFNIAEKYQIPVLLMTEEYLTDYNMTIDPFDFSKIKIERYLAKESDIIDERYKRYKFTESGISPRLIPGKVKGKVVLVDSHEHNEYGNIEESTDNRIKMMDKRMKKLEGLKDEIQEPWFIGKENPENLIVCWGATYGAVKEAVDILNTEGGSIGALIYGDIWPFPTKRINEMGKKAKRIIDIEQNATGQLESLINEFTDIKCTDRILKYDGRPINGDEIIQKLNLSI